MTKMKRNNNPYQNVDWNNRIEIVGCTHMHCVHQEAFQKYINEGLQLASISNYYPSTPAYPLKEVRKNLHRAGQSGYIKNGKIIDEEIDFNAVINTWKDELPPEVQAELPLSDGDLLFSNIPDDLLEVPNAEHAWFSDASIYLHITAPGSTATTSHFDLKHKFGLSEHGYNLGCPVPWREGFSYILNKLITPDGGGIIINHPTWSHLPVKFICEMLDYDERVLGIEVYSFGARTDFTDFSDAIWDEVLATGRQCFGFFVQDHPKMDRPWQGKIVLLPEERTAESCLKAMREGRFYGLISDNGLRFEHISFDGKTLSAKCNRPVDFQILSAKGVVGDLIRGTEMSLTFTEEEKAEHVFLRLTAREGREVEKLFSQAFML